MTQSSTLIPSLAVGKHPAKKSVRLFVEEETGIQTD